MQIRDGHQAYRYSLIPEVMASRRYPTNTVSKNMHDVEERKRKRYKSVRARKQMQQNVNA